ncbi:hypothetical protein GCM10028805_08840 [Spirosoma harenae]
MSLPIKQRLTTYLAPWELWFHALLGPVLIPICNYFFIGPLYFSNWQLFLTATGLLTVLYLIPTLLITVSIRWIINRYADVDHSTHRTLAILIALTSLSTGAVLFDVFIYSLIPSFGLSFTWSVIRPVLLLTLVFDFIFGTFLSLFHSYRQWANDQTENEQLRQATYQHQLDILKMQINPHFLFNSLNSLSSLIGEDRQRASQFVDELSKVYRYLLQANTREFVSLQTERDFSIAYSNLLQTRYGMSLQITHQIHDDYLQYQLPTLSLQTLIDNAIKHNIMAIDQPLLISIQTMPDGKLLVQNSLQRKINKIEQAKSRLASLASTYRSLGNGDVQIDETSTHFGVLLPLLATTSQLVS